MRLFIALSLLAVPAAGCSHGGDGTAVPTQWPPTFKPSPVVHRLNDRQAAGGVRSARGFWIRGLNAAARQYPGIRFRSPSRTVLLARLRREARAHDFQVMSFRMLRPRQLAPLVVVRTTHYVDLARATGSILEKLDPDGRYDRDYEGFHFEAQDERGVPLFVADNVMRGRIEGGQWARSEPLYPFEHG
jgi:hypothetical protein